MRTLSILALGAIALFAMEVMYSMEIQKYEARPLSKAERPRFFCGPITVTIKAILNLDAPATPAPIRSI